MTFLRLSLLGAAIATTSSPFAMAGELGEMFDGVAMVVDLIYLNETNTTTQHGGKHIESHLTDRCYFAFDVDMPGSDYNTQTTVSSECCPNCKADDNCHAFTFTDYNGGTCWYKYFPAPARFKKGAISSMVLVQQDQSMYYRIENCDMPGNDISNELQSDPKICSGKCYRNTECLAFTWSNYNGGTCWYKSAVRECVSTPGVKSGIMFA